jgi:hypothetical protein
MEQRELRECMVLEIPLKGRGASANSLQERALRLARVQPQAAIGRSEFRHWSKRHPQIVQAL